MSTKAQTTPKTKSPLEGFHPKQHVIDVVMNNGNKFQILTTWGKEGDSLRLDVDPTNHPAWQDKGQNFVNVNNERVSKFKKKFGDFGDFGG
jgi:large subunit ribosomal protein L31